MMSRKEANVQIARAILAFTEDPGSEDLRFGQILAILNITEFVYDDNGILMYPKDIFNEESSVTLERMKESNK